MNDTTRPIRPPAAHGGAGTSSDGAPSGDSGIDPPSLAPDEADPFAAVDPHRSMRCALESRGEPTATAEDAVLSWLLHLPHDVDPALAARQLMAAVDGGCAGRSRLGRLMSEIGCWPEARLARLDRRTRRAPG